MRELLVGFSETVHYYSGIMDVIVSHHPEYVALAYGAMKFLFIASPCLLIFLNFRSNTWF